MFSGAVPLMPLKPQEHIYNCNLLPCPNWFPLPAWDLTGMDQDTWDLTLARRAQLKVDTVKKMSRKYQISTWLSVSQYAKISLVEWIGASDSFTILYGVCDLIKEAIALEVKEIVTDLNKEREEQRQQLKMAQMQTGTNLAALDKSNSSMSRVYR